MFFLPAIVLLLRELAGEALRSILRRGSCSFAALTSEHLLAARPHPACYGFSHCRAFPPGTHHSGLMWLLPRNARSLLRLWAAREVFRSCLPSGISVVTSLLWYRELRMSSQPEMQPPAVLSPTSSWVFGVTTSCCEPAGHRSCISSSLGWRSTGGTRQGRARTVIQRGTCERFPQRGVSGYLNQVLGCSLIKLKFS